MGHSGTLDPLATGVLVLCLGRATRLAEYVQRMAKTYRAGLLLGARSDTDDADGTVTPVAGARPPDPAALAAGVAGLVGAIEQVPPAYSAAKVTGQRAYDLARAGRDVTLQARRVQVHGIDVLRYDYPQLEVEVRCGKGTYIRSLARDLGERLGCGSLVAVLRRTRVGPFRADDAVTLETGPATARSRLLPPEMAVAELPRVTLAERELQRLRNGQAVPLPGEPAGEAGTDTEAEVAVFSPAGALMAVAVLDRTRRLVRPGKVL
jgi:tRNA pseudouridine55 synthase